MFLLLSYQSLEDNKARNSKRNLNVKKPQHKPVVVELKSLKAVRVGILV